MEFDAVILAGGRSSRLGGTAKAELRYDGATLLERALKASYGAGSVVVVGPPREGLPPGVLSTREEPPFAGPAAAIAAGVEMLAGRAEGLGDWVLVLACDMPRADRAISVLLSAVASHPDSDGVMAVSGDGRKQPLLGFYRAAALRREAASAAARGRLTNASMFGLLARLELLPVAVPAGCTDDVDTWEDAAALGIDGSDN